MSGLIQRPMGTFRHGRLTVFPPGTPPGVLARHPLAARLLALWNGWRGDRVMPERDQVNPLYMRGLLENIVLLDAVDGDFRFRLVGEAVNSRYGHGLKGRTLGERLAGAALDETLYEHRRCVDDVAGVLVRNTRDAATLNDQLLYTRLLLPLADADGRAGHVLGVMQFHGLDA